MASAAGNIQPVTLAPGIPVGSVSLDLNSFRQASPTLLDLSRFRVLFGQISEIQPP
jgi:hypothetical protein